MNQSTEIVILWSHTSLSTHPHMIKSQSFLYGKSIILLMETALYITEPHHDKTNKMSVRPTKTKISLGIRPVWSESSLSAWRKLESLATHWAHSEDWSDWTDAQADLGTHSLCWFCHVAAHFSVLCLFYLYVWTLRASNFYNFKYLWGSIIYHISDRVKHKSSEPEHDKTYKTICALREDPLIRVLDLVLLHIASEDTNQIARMRGLIWVFARCSCDFVCFVVLRLF